MLTTSKFMERLGQRVRTRDVVPVSSGSPARLSLSFLHRANTPEAARILVKRQLPLRTAHALLTEMVDLQGVRDGSLRRRLVGTEE